MQVPPKNAIDLCLINGLIPYEALEFIIRKGAGKYSPGSIALASHVGPVGSRKWQGVCRPARGSGVGIGFGRGGVIDEWLNFDLHPLRQHSFEVLQILFQRRLLQQ